MSRREYVSTAAQLPPPTDRARVLRGAAGALGAAGAGLASTWIRTRWPAASGAPVADFAPPVTTIWTSEPYGSGESGRNRSTVFFSANETLPVTGLPSADTVNARFVDFL